MGTAFIIMQIGDADLDEVCKKAIVPAIEACGLEAKRVDKHNQGGLLKSEIVSFILEAEIIIADLTNERPNCYLEVGYAMGADKTRNLILTVREDHFPDSPRYAKNGPRVHFDLAGYDILSWNPNDLPSFCAELQKRIQRRRSILGPVAPRSTPWDENWISAQREAALSGLNADGFPGYMEIRFALAGPKPSFPQGALSKAAQMCQIDTFGWPIGVFLDNRPEYRPRPRADGIMAEVRSSTSGKSYDYWAIKRTGDFYSLSSLFEDSRQPRQEIFFNTRIVRTTEALLYCAGLYGRLGVERSSRIHFAMRYGGLNGRVMSSSDPRRALHRYRNQCVEDETDVEIEIALDEIQSRLVETVEKLADPLFVLFDYCEISTSVYEDIVNRFVAGHVS